MSDQPTTPPTAGLSAFTCAFNLHEFLLVAGVTRVVLPAPPDTDLAFQTAWLQTVSISPPAALSLFNALRESVAQYEHQFGAIPRAPETGTLQ